MQSHTLNDRSPSTAKSDLKVSMKDSVMAKETKACGLWGEGLVWLIGAVVCLLTATAGLGVR